MSGKKICCCEETTASSIRNVQVKQQAQRGHLEMVSEKVTTHPLHEVSTFLQRARDLYSPRSPEKCSSIPLPTKAYTDQYSRKT